MLLTKPKNHQKLVNTLKHPFYTFTSLTHSSHTCFCFFSFSLTQMQPQQQKPLKMLAFVLHSTYHTHTKSALRFNASKNKGKVMNNLNNEEREREERRR